MKEKVFRSVLLFGTFLSLFSCSDEENVANGISGVKKNDVQVVQILNDGSVKAITRSDNVPSENLALKFSSEEVYQATVTKLENMTVEEKAEWGHQFPSFQSLEAVYNEAMEYAADSLDESKESYLKFRNKYSQYLYFPEYKEDYGFYIPLCSMDKDSKMLASLTNKRGILVIGDKMIEQKKIDSYEMLQSSLSDVYYCGNSESIDQKPISRAANDINWNLVSYVNTNDINTVYRIQYGENALIGSEYDSGWRTGGKRKKLRFKFGRMYKNNALCWHSEVSFRKKTWLGWTNYASETSLNGTLYLYGDLGYMNSQAISHASDHFSSHDGYGLLNGIGIESDTSSASSFIFSFPEIRATATISFRGFYSDEEYVWKMTKTKMKTNIGNIQVAN